MAEDPNKPTAVIAQRGGAPGGANGASPHTPGKATPKSPRESGRVARNDKNVFALPVTRLKVGWWNHMPGDVTRFRLWIPTNTGGVLTIQYKTGTVDLRKPFRKVLKPAAGEIVCPIKIGDYGEYFVIARGKAGEQVLCTFIQTGFARDGSGDSDPPLIPWNFWYWPTSASEKNQYFTGAADVLARYAKAFGHDPEACRQEEHTAHATDEVKKAPFYDWQGHCHLSAPASAVFEEPKALTFRGESFSADELKFLAAEYFGNFGRIGELVWELKQGPSTVGKRWYLPAFFKPGSPKKDRATFINGLKHEFRNDEPWDDPKLNGFAAQVADTWIGNLGGADQFQKQIDDWLGQLAADFYQTLIDMMLLGKHALMANMRPYNANGGPDQVWNQTYFWYQAWYREHGPLDTGGPEDKRAGADDEKDMMILCELRANKDHIDPKTGMTLPPPAEVSGNQTVPVDERALVFHNRWRILFDGSGEIIPDDPKNGWHNLTNNQGHELFAPTELLPIAKCETTRKSGDARKLGNKFLGTDIVKAGLLKIHKRYQ